MNTLKKFLLFIPILCILFSVCTPIVAFASDDVYNFEINEPLVGDNSGYLALLFYNPNTVQQYTVEIWSWVAIPYTGSTDEINANSTYALVDFTSSGSAKYIDISIRPSVTSDTVGYFVQFARSYSTNVGADTTYYFDVISGALPAEQSIRINSNSSQLIGFQSYGNVGRINGKPSTATNDFIVTFGSDTSEYQNQIEGINKIIQLINSLNLTNEQLEETYSLLSDYLKKIYSNTDDISATLDRIWEDFYYWTWQVDADHARIIELLEQAIDGEKPSNQDSFQDSYDDYADIEQDLINNEEASNAIGDFDVSIEGGAYSVIWNMITDFLNSNSKVFGLFIACLTLAFIALLLHR